MSITPLQVPDGTYACLTGIHNGMLLSGTRLT